MKKLFDTNFFIRLVSALFISGVFIFATIAGGFFFSILILGIASICYLEWFNIIIGRIKDQSQERYQKYLGFWGLIGTLIILPSAASMLYLRFGKYSGSEYHAVKYIFFLVSILAATDIGAYIFGRLIGGPKLAKNISPNKTISGSFAGIISSIVVAMIFKIFFHIGPESLHMIGIAALLSVLAQIGGLIMSSFKRHFNVKDFSNFIPGHGGFFDRIDSYMIALPVFVLFIILNIFF